MNTTTNNNHRPINAIARDIAADWKKVHFTAKPYLDAMFSLVNITDNYYFDSGMDIVCRFLSNAAQYRGGRSKELKNELRAMVGLKIVK